MPRGPSLVNDPETGPRFWQFRAGSVVMTWTFAMAARCSAVKLPHDDVASTETAASGAKCPHALAIVVRSWC